MLYQILCLFSMLLICLHNQDEEEVVDHQVSSLPLVRTISLSYRLFPTSYFFVSHTRSEVEQFAGVLTELNNTRGQRLSPSPRNDAQPTQHRLPPPPPPSLRGDVPPAIHRPPPPPIPARNLRTTTVE
jgi:hypothetical protein